MMHFRNSTSSTNVSPLVILQNEITAIFQCSHAVHFLTIFTRKPNKCVYHILFFKKKGKQKCNS